MSLADSPTQRLPHLDALAVRLQSARTPASRLTKMNCASVPGFLLKIVDLGIGDTGEFDGHYMYLHVELALLSLFIEVAETNIWTGVVSPESSSRISVNTWKTRAKRVFTDGISSTDTKAMRRTALTNIQICKRRFDA